MVTVAKNLDGPIKILFPRDSLERNPVTGKLELSLLGLGDIVIPGFFLALLLRFDAHNAMHGTKTIMNRTTTRQGKDKEPAVGSSSSANGDSTTTAATSSSTPYLMLRAHDSFDKPYFHSALLAYVLGLGLTMFIMIQFKAAQPALLYLVPACLISSLGCAYVRGEVKHLFAYSEEEEEEEEAAAVDGDETDKKEEAKKDK